MAGALGRLNIDLTLNTANFTNAINRSQRQTEQFGQSIRVSLQAITVQQERMVLQTAKSSALFARFASVTASALSIHQVINYADSWTELQNRLKLVTESSVELNKATQAVYDIAQRTYQSLDATAQIYQRFADNADRLGLSQQKVAELTETVSKAVAISGASATAAQAALTQFGQALASGQLRGEELNSVMEQTPALAKAIDDLARANSVAQFAYDRGKEIEQMQFETTLIGKSRAEQEKLNALRQIDVLYQQASVDLGEKELANLQRNVELTKQQIEEELRKREAMKGDPMAGLKQGLSDFSESAMDVMENVRNVTTNALNNMSDALADFALTGKGSFKDFANAVISDITRMVMKMLIFKAIEAGGQAMGFDMGWMSKGHAYGGYTGHGGKFEPKGIVHGGEFVFTKEATAKLGVGNLYRLMHAAQGYASGGFVGAIAGRIPVTPQPTLARAGGVQMTVFNHITVTGNGDAVLAQAMKEAAQQGTEAGAQKAHAMMLQDFQSNGAARRTLGV
ncbi:phage tail tape measure protein [Proteus terrae]|uniref:phage tail tape measure protein n=1 Tax=Proteus terrae TaxID=1574161 RepID=UPI0034D3B5C0